MERRTPELLLASLIGIAALVGCQPRAPSATGVSDLRSDESVVFYTTDASRDEDGGSWRVPVHAWVHEPETTVVRREAIAFALKSRYGLEATAATAPNLARRVEPFVADSEGGKRLVVELAGRLFELPPSAANGHVMSELTVDAESVAGVARAGGLALRVVLARGDERLFSGRANLVEASGLSVISDIDDTVKISEVGDHRALFDRTFLRDFEAVPGMAELYRRWAAQGAALHFVSSSPWQLHEPLDEFLEASGFPARSLSLKLIRAKDRTLLDLFKEGSETKPAQIEPLLRRFAGRRFVLVGDSGEQDPEVYGALMREHGDRILHAYIRNVDGSLATDARYQCAFESIDPERWTLFTDPAALRLPGTGHGEPAGGRRAP